MARGEQLGATSAATFTELPEHFLKRRYQHYSALLQKGPLREEVLAHVARQPSPSTAP
jgi:hypothetical protein